MLPLLDCLESPIPQGTETNANENGLAFYDDVIDTCLKHHIEPVITLSHYELPLNLAINFGGWKNKALITFFKRFADTVIERWGNKVKYFLTFNEINSAAHFPVLSQGMVGDTPKKPSFKLCTTNLSRLLMRCKLLAALILTFKWAI
jgi:6-phospho-beta-glucosidase